MTEASATVEVYVSIGSNIERERRLREGVRLLRERFGPLELSSVYESPAVGFSGAPFYNLVAGFATTASMPEVVTSLRGIEDRCGRDRAAPRYSSRTLDVDLLLYGESITTHGSVEVPRAEITCRAYVLGPLAEIAPDRRHPTRGQTFGDLWREFHSGRNGMRKVALELE